MCIKVQLCGVNFSDIYTRQGFLRQLKTPRVLGVECYGTIEAIGNEVNNFQVIKNCSNLLLFVIFFIIIIDLK